MSHTTNACINKAHDGCSNAQCDCDCHDQCWKCFDLQERIKELESALKNAGFCEICGETVKELDVHSMVCFPCWNNK